MRERDKVKITASAGDVTNAAVANQGLRLIIWPNKIGANQINQSHSIVDMEVKVHKNDYDGGRYAVQLWWLRSHGMMIK